MKAITLHQPYATLIALGVKIHETRSWPCPLKPGEMLAIHAGKTVDANGVVGLRDLLPRIPSLYVRPSPADIKSVLPTGAIVCVTRFRECVPTHHLRPLKVIDAADMRCGDFSLDRFAWKLDLLEVLDPPIPARGRQGIWNWERPQ